MNRVRPIAITMVAVFLAACSVSPSLQEQEPPSLPDQWLLGGSHSQAAPIERNWWRDFGSAELDLLIDRAEAQSLDVAAAVARLRQAAATARVSRSSLLPDLVGTIQGQRGDSIDSDLSSTNDSDYSAGLVTTYELDLWGRNRANLESAQRKLQASAFDADVVRLTVIASVASTWLRLASLRERIDIADLNQRAAEKFLMLVESRAHAGAATELELAQQRGLVARQRRSLSSLRQEGEDARVSINVLLGEAAGMELRQSSVRALTVPAIDAGLPSDLLTRRPDVARAEAMLAAADADVFAARRAMLPGVILTTGLSADGAHIDGIFDDPLYSLAVALTAPIFKGGQLAAERDFAIARREELLSEYRATIVAAFGDVQQALNAIDGLEAQRTNQDEELKQAQRALTLAEVRYRAGAETLLTLLDAQRTWYDAQDQAVQLKVARLQAQIDLYAALGGGWRSP